jgi:hypothetical protein
MSNATAFWLRVNGYPATEIAAHTPPTWETHADGGIGAVTWEFALTARSQHQALRKGALVEVMCGPMPVASGLMTEPDRSSWQCHAFGLSSSLGRIAALDSGGNATRDLSAAVTQAIADGSLVTNPVPVSGTAAGDATGNPSTIGTILTDYAEQTGQRWGVDGERRLYMRPDPTSPTWLASPDAAAFGVTDEDAPTRILGRYEAGGGAYATAKVGVPGLDETVDLTSRGPLTLAAAEAILSGMLQRAGETSWVNGVTLHREQLTTRGGTPAFLASVTAGQMLRAHGLASNVISQAPWLDVVIGKTKYTAGDDMIYLEPVNTVPRTAAGVWAA